MWDGLSLVQRVARGGGSPPMPYPAGLGLIVGDGDAVDDVSGSLLALISAAAIGIMGAGATTCSGLPGLRWRALE